MSDIHFNTAFAKDVLSGLQQNPKRLHSKYFYDKSGDRIFQEIMAMPEYYLTNSEYEIFNQQKEDILKKIGKEPFELIELGAGDGYKTKVLLRYFLDQSAIFTYRPIDISKTVLQQLQNECKSELPNLEVSPLEGDYFQVIKELKHEKNRVRKVILFLGSNIGNYTPDEAHLFLSALAQNLNQGDILMIGIDLKKDPQIILDAYNDPAGITERFNKNLLLRINRELNANFDPDQFVHWVNYNPITGATKSYLLSKTKQDVLIKAINKTIHFSAWEPIFMEISQKYSLSEINDLAKRSGFKVQWNFSDSNRYFVDTLWVVNGH